MSTTPSVEQQIDRLDAAYEQLMDAKIKRREYQREYYRKNRDKMRAYGREYQRKNRAKLYARRNAWNAAHREVVKAQSRAKGAKRRALLTELMERVARLEAAIALAEPVSTADALPAPVRAEAGA